MDREAEDIKPSFERNGAVGKRHPRLASTPESRAQEAGSPICGLEEIYFPPDTRNICNGGKTLRLDASISNGVYFIPLYFLLDRSTPPNVLPP